MKERKLNYRFHNPNTAAVTADYLLKILIECNAENGKSDAGCSESGGKRKFEEQYFANITLHIKEKIF